MMKYQLIVLTCCLFISCNTSKKIAYLQDANDGDSKKAEIDQCIVVQPNDILSIVVSSKNPELAVSFNLPMLTYQAGSGMTNIGYMQKILGYVVDEQGFIDFPILGKLKVTGYSRDQVSSMIKHKLIGEDLVKDPIVTTEFMNFKISVLGEVTLPGTYKVENDRITILEALSMARDLTIYGKRDNVTVIREKDDNITTYRVDLRSTNLFESPVYYLQQNDIVYVEPNKVMAGRSRINENKSLSLWISLASFITTLAVLFVK